MAISPVSDGAGQSTEGVPYGKIKNTTTFGMLVRGFKGEIKWRERMLAFRKKLVLKKCRFCLSTMNRTYSIFRVDSGRKALPAQPAAPSDPPPGEQQAFHGWDAINSPLSIEE